MLRCAAPRDLLPAPGPRARELASRLCAWACGVLRARRVVARLVGAALVTASCGSAAADGLRVGYVTGVEPSKAGIYDGSFEHATGQHIDWRRFDNGADVVRALASGDLDIANLGSSVVAVAAARQLAIETILVASQLGTSEALVARDATGIHSPADLVGKTIAVPFVSTAHYSLMAALRHWGIDKGRVRVVNLRISEIPAAWSAGYIDAAYVWDPALGAVCETGHVLASSADLAAWNSPTFDVWVARKDYSARSPVIVAGFVRNALDLMQAYRTDPAAFTGDAAIVGRIVRATGAKASDIGALLAGNRYPNATEQRSLLTGNYVRALADTAAFLKEQGKVDTVLANYQGYSTARFLPDNPTAAAARPR